MTWMKMACDTYDQNPGMVANFQSDVYLCPIAHMESSAQIEVSLDLQGNLTGARSIEDKEAAACIIPVTEESASRSSGDAPHPLCDNLTYVAGDYAGYARSEKEAKTAKGRFAKYIEGLAAWKDSNYSNATIEAVYAYLSKEQLMADLIQAAVVKLDGEGKLTTNKMGGNTYDKCIVRFQIDVLSGEKNCWQNLQVIEDYQHYYLEKKAQEAREDICYLTGETGVISANHPKGILAASYGAKLISANDDKDFTYRGRFYTGEEAYAVSYEASQKAHNALRWLAKQQGFYVGKTDKRFYLCWNPAGKHVPQVGENLFGSSSDEGIFSKPTTMPEYKTQLKKCINGHKNQFKTSDDIAIMAMEAATTGRLSIVYYHAMKAPEFFARIENWYQDCCWTFPVFDADRKRKLVVKTPEIIQIVNNAFGVERENQQGKSMLYVNDKLMIMQYQRLFHCIVDGKILPRDFVDGIFRQCNKPLSFSKRNREYILSTACALIRKYWKQTYGKEIEMALDRKEQNRDYCYGRLLAVYEKIERSTYGKDENREPNAIRMQSMYVQRPASTLALLEQKSIPYLESLPPQKREFYRQEIGEILNLIGIDKENKALGYLYLTGYYAEREDLRWKNKAKSEEKEEETK